MPDQTTSMPLFGCSAPAYQSASQTDGCCSWSYRGTGTKICFCSNSSAFILVLITSFLSDKKGSWDAHSRSWISLNHPYHFNLYSQWPQPSIPNSNIPNTRNTRGAQHTEVLEYSSLHSTCHHKKVLLRVWSKSGPTAIKKKTIVNLHVSKMMICKTCIFRLAEIPLHRKTNPWITSFQQIIQVPNGPLLPKKSG